MEAFAKKILSVLAAALLLFYVGYHVFMAAYSPVTLQTAVLYDEYETIDTSGIVLRDETLISANNGGYVYYVAENGGRVSKDGSIADLYADQGSAVRQQRLTALNQEIEQLKNIQEQGKNNRTNLNIITTQLKKTQSSLIFEMASANYDEMESLSAQLLALMNKQQITVGRVNDFDARIAQLEAERDQLLQTDTAPIGSVYSPVAGYFVNSVDGYETSISTDELTGLTPTQVRAAMEHQPSVDTAQYIGKVVSGYEWYLACVISAEDMSRLLGNSSIRLRLPFVSNNIIPVTLVAENRDRNGDLAVVFRCDYMSTELADIRLEQVQILVEQHSGLLVPDKAVTFNDNQEPGVFVQEGNVLHFRRIKVSYHSSKESYSICEVISPDDPDSPYSPSEAKTYLQMYDDIVLEGKNLYDGKVVR